MEDSTVDIDEKETIKDIENCDSVKRVKTIDQTDLPENVIDIGYDNGIQLNPKRKVIVAVLDAGVNLQNVVVTDFA